MRRFWWNPQWVYKSHRKFPIYLATLRGDMFAARTFQFMKVINSKITNAWTFAVTCGAVNLIQNMILTFKFSPKCIFNLEFCWMISYAKRLTNFSTMMPVCCIFERFHTIWSDLCVARGSLYQSVTLLTSCHSSNSCSRLWFLEKPILFAKS